MSVDLVVVGMGYVGLPLASEATRAGLKVVGFDTSLTVVTGLNAGVSHIDDVPDDEVHDLLARGFVATSDQSILSTAATVIICVPTPLAPGGGPDLRAVNAALDAVARHLQRGQLIVLESTTYPGTTDEVAKPLLEASGLIVGTDIHLAFSPERIDPGNISFGVANTPKVVGGCTPACTQAAVGFYSRFISSVFPAKGTREAEMSKLLENTYRHVNIALVNELARFCHELEIDIWNVIELASSKPFGFQAFRPGPGVGGHCIPIDPQYLAYKVRTELGQTTQFIELAQQINAGMPGYIVERATAQLGRTNRPITDAKVLLLGVSYKADIADTRETPATALRLAFNHAGAEVTYYDPLVPVWRAAGGVHLRSEPDLDTALASCDLAVLVQAHTAFDLIRIAKLAPLVFDTRGILPKNDNVESL